MMRVNIGTADSWSECLCLCSAFLFSMSTCGDEASLGKDNIPWEGKSLRTNKSCTFNRRSCVSLGFVLQSEALAAQETRLSNVCLQICTKQIKQSPGERLNSRGIIELKKQHTVVQESLFCFNTKKRSFSLQKIQDWSDFFFSVNCLFFPFLMKCCCSPLLKQL